MNFKDIKFDWLTRLMKVITFLLFILVTLTTYPFASEMGWNNSVSIALLYGALWLFIGYILLILITKIVLYIFKGENFLKSGFNKKHYFILASPIILVLLGASIFGFFVEPNQKKAETQKIEIAYKEAMAKIDSLREEYRNCSAPTIEKIYSEKVRSCSLLKNKVRSDYNICVKYSALESPASCLYKNDYEKIDCSESTLYDKAKSETRGKDLSISCQFTLSELTANYEIITNYLSQTK